MVLPISMTVLPANRKGGDAAVISPLATRTVSFRMVDLNSVRSIVPGMRHFFFPNVRKRRPSCFLVHVRDVT